MVNWYVKDNGTSVSVAEDREIFLLLLHFEHAWFLGDRIYIDKPSARSDIIDMGCTLQYSLATHALTGYDPDCTYWVLENKLSLMYYKYVSVKQK